MLHKDEKHTRERILVRMLLYFISFRFVQGKHEKNRFVKVDFFGLIACFTFLASFGFILFCIHLYCFAKERKKVWQRKQCKKQGEERKERNSFK